MEQPIPSALSAGDVQGVIESIPSNFPIRRFIEETA